MPKIKILLLLCLGFFCLSLGAIGIVLPGLPTTPFVILAAICFSKSSPRIYAWLKRTKYFGPYIEHYRTKQGVSKRLKAVSIAVVWLSLAISMFILQAIWAYTLLSLVGICVTVHIVLIRARRK
ncbi:MAG: YbaN family protein [Oscillospiraceae bacterium]|nr:YbaN family protein [Oscillospiraceae bacterium]